jgi:hypothetical protein
MLFTLLNSPRRNIMKNFYPTISMLAITGMLTLPIPAVAQPTYPHYGMMMGPGMWQSLTPEQQLQMQQNMQRMWENMHQQGYGPGMMMTPGMGPALTPEQREQMLQNMQRMREYRQMYGPGPDMMMLPGKWEPMTPDEYKKWWDSNHPSPPEKSDKKK